MASTSQETTSESSKKNNWDNPLIFLKYHAIPVSVGITLMLELIVLLVSDRNGTGFVSRLTMNVVIILEVLSVAWLGVVSGFAHLLLIAVVIRGLLRLLSVCIPALRVDPNATETPTETKAMSIEGRSYSAFVFLVLPFIMILNGAIYAREANSPVGQGAYEQFFGKGDKEEGDKGNGGKWARGIPIQSMILGEIFGIAAPAALLFVAFISSMLQKRFSKKTDDLEAVSAGPEEEAMIMMEATRGSDTAVVPGTDERHRDSGETLV
ncbi:hypothetical protein C8J56DRAFT_1037875 [Mycena floridula]|nr:hypothetical protein C8J56DRAFT_1037875 [Mycena floridula]